VHPRIALARGANERKDKRMTRFLLTLIAMLSIGSAVANAATPHQAKTVQQGDSFNWLEGGGG
jgi:ABC-type proline/glycine betaine transport system substrate-binding protein